jgi:DNA-binding protein H-NS
MACSWLNSLPELLLQAGGTMARKSKNTVTSMSIKALFKLRDEVAEAIASRAAELRRQLDELTRTKTRGRKRGPNGTKGRKVAPQFRSKKHPKQVWSGRGATPRWMRDEMKGTKLTKESFRIR